MRGALAVEQLAEGFPVGGRHARSLCERRQFGGRARDKKRARRLPRRLGRQAAPAGGTQQRGRDRVARFL